MGEELSINAESYLGIASPGKTQSFTVADAVVLGERRSFGKRGKRPKLLKHPGNQQDPAQMDLNERNQWPSTRLGRKCNQWERTLRTTSDADTWDALAS